METALLFDCKDLEITDTLTGRELSLFDWAYEHAKSLIYTDLNFVIKVDDSYIVLDECGHWDVIDTNRFHVKHK